MDVVLNFELNQSRAEMMLKKQKPWIQILMCNHLQQLVTSKLGYTHSRIYFT